MTQTWTPPPLTGRELAEIARGHLPAFHAARHNATVLLRRQQAPGWKE